MHADARYFSQLARAAHQARIGSAIGAKPITMMQMCHRSPAAPNPLCLALGT